MCRELTPWEKALEFHGHICPGLALGYRVAEIALEKLREKRASDEELVVIAENDSCSVDAIMVITGCTIGKGNLILKDTGKQVYIFGSRNSKQAIRIAVNRKATQRNSVDRELHQRVIDGTATPEEKEKYSEMRMDNIKNILEMPSEQLATIKEIEFSVPGKARLFQSVECALCGEHVMEPSARVQDGKIVCLDCFEEYSRTIKVG